MLLVVGLLLEIGLMVAGYFIWRGLVIDSRFLLWRLLLEKYPPRPDTCVQVLPNMVEAFVIHTIRVGSSSMQVTGCSLVIGEKGIHLAPGLVPRCPIGWPFKKNFAFIPWSRLERHEESGCLEVLGTGDALVIRDCDEASAWFDPMPKRASRGVGAF